MKNLVKDASTLREAMRKGCEITKLRKEDMRVVNVQVILLIFLLVNLQSIINFNIFSGFVLLVNS